MDTCPRRYLRGWNCEAHNFFRKILRRQDPKDDTTLDCLNEHVVCGCLRSQVSSENEMGRAFWVYLLASQKNGTLYCGHTDDLARRVFDHREGRGSAFTRKYRVHQLVWYEPHESRESAKTQEYQVKKWKRAWKIRLIERENPNWDDLYLRLNR